MDKERVTRNFSQFPLLVILGSNFLPCSFLQTVDGVSEGKESEVFWFFLKATVPPFCSRMVHVTGTQHMLVLYTELWLACLIHLMKLIAKILEPQCMQLCDTACVSVVLGHQRSCVSIRPIELILMSSLQVKFSPAQIASTRAQGEFHP